MQLQPPLHRLRSRTWILVIAPILSLGLLWSWLRRPDSLLLQQFLVADSNNLPLAAASDDGHAASSGSAAGDGGGSSMMNNHNANLPGMDDILVILKTGVTEALGKVPVHLETTFSSVPNFAIFSDYKETIAGVETHDVLSRINEHVKRNIPEFELYNRIHAQGREALTPADYGDDSNGPFGRQNNPGWKLDKWKFLPMIPAALELKPDAKWFVFMEADSYFLWPNLVAWLSQLDPQRDWYLGFPMQIGDIIFAYGGAGFVISNPVMQKVSEYLATNAAELDEFTASQWAGDCVLGKVFADAGVGLNWSWPTLQNDKPWELDHFASIYDKRAWCYPLVSYHHMQPDDIREMWEFDRDWFKLDDPTTKLLLYSDAFRRMILPDILSLRIGWDNGAKDEVANEERSPKLGLTLEGCGQRCADDENCLQYRYHEDDGSCFTSSAAMRGIAAPRTVKSNWMIDRIFDKMKTYGQRCTKAEFVL
ncbi:hypothetical protein UA08_07235 [Talaromyces atroroseus]|uniref:N-acetylgalactosaminide beta-1,3-galactosyltransferase n=1 Tax=Talaromyces atroroseus TaxID=1441469 RepID=A0A225AF55_TALAT|nr:hypothetical protein UA08_07235 [Talaromyces atroroseus]OKL57733.1 hypothetical protein UA08_07235 [Talaromyces atroroseus]